MIVSGLPPEEARVATGLGLNEAWNSSVRGRRPEGLVLNSWLHVGHRINPVNIQFRCVKMLMIEVCSYSGRLISLIVIFTLDT